MLSTEFSVAKPPPTCYNSTVRRVGISVLQRLPKPLRRVRLPYPAPKRKTPVRVSFFLEQGFCCAKSFACGRAAERARGCRLHTITASSGEGMPGGERIQATMVFEKII